MFFKVYQKQIQIDDLSLSYSMFDQLFAILIQTSGVFKILKFTQVLSQIKLCFVQNIINKVLMIILANPQGNNGPISIIRSQQHPNTRYKISRMNSKALLKSKGWKGKWSGREELKYIEFIELNQQIMDNPKKRASCKIFAKMSKVVRTRNANQCRSHHQKLIKYHSNVKNILVYYKRVVFKRWEAMIKDNPGQLSRIATIKRLCANEEVNYSLRVLGSTVKIQIDASSGDIQQKNTQSFCELRNIENYNQVKLKKGLKSAQTSLINQLSDISCKNSQNSFCLSLKAATQLLD